MTTAERGRNVAGAVVALALLAVWQGAIAVGVIDFEYVPMPTKVGTALVDEVQSGTLLTALTHTTFAALTAWAAAVAVGGVLGTALGLSARGRAWAATSVDVLRTLPVIAFIPIAALLFGLSTTTEIVVAAWSAAWPVVINTMGGVQAVHPRLNEVAAVMHLTRRQRLVAIVLPAASALVLVGARLALALALVVTVAAEMIANPAGIGYEIVQNQQALRPDAMFAYILVVGALGVVLNGILQIACRRLAPYAVSVRAA
jgi:sulfonate transport system permease protein